MKKKELKAKLKAAEARAAMYRKAAYALRDCPDGREGIEARVTLKMQEEFEELICMGFEKREEDLLKMAKQGIIYYSGEKKEETYTKSQIDAVWDEMCKNAHASSDVVRVKWGFMDRLAGSKDVDIKYLKVLLDRDHLLRLIKTVIPTAEIRRDPVVREASEEVRFDMMGHECGGWKDAVLANRSTSELWDLYERCRT